MATETASLIFRADTRDLQTADRRLKDVARSGRSAANEIDRLGRESQETARQTRGLNTAMGNLKDYAKANAKSLAATAVSLATIGATIKTVSIAREFDKINASLKTMTGNSDNAERAFRQIQDFAKTTPYDLAQVATAFTKLMSLGLNPSEEALRSYGNTASAMGKDLNQMIEAVADAATGEFERLKEFGIRASSEGDRVSFTFQGVTTTIGKNAAEIEGYLMRLGEVQFAGAMAERAATLDGAISNLGDSWDALFLTISQGKVGGFLEDTARSATSLINELRTLIALSNGTATAQEQLAAVEEELAEIEANRAAGGKVAEMITQGRYERTLALQKSLKLQIDLEAELAEREAEVARVQREGLAIANEKQLASTKNIEALNKENEALMAQAQVLDEQAKQRRDLEQKRAQERLSDIQALNMTEMELIGRQESERIAEIQGYRDQELISEQEFEDAKTEIMVNAMNQRMALLEADLASRDEAIRLHAENDRLMNEMIEAERQAQDEARAERAQVLNERLLAAEDLLLKGKSEKQKAAFRIGVNLANEEKRENAKKIISSTFTAAMDAYKALAGIPVIGPALGAAAYATVVATGVQAAAQSLSGRALGGQVRAGESYVVGERGPEVLTMGTGGRITPNEALGTAQPSVVSKTANVSFNIQANDTQGFDQLLSNRRGQIISMINQALNDQGKAALV